MPANLGNDAAQGSVLRHTLTISKWHRVLMMPWIVSSAFYLWLEVQWFMTAMWTVESGFTGFIFIMMVHPESGGRMPYPPCLWSS